MEYIKLYMDFAKINFLTQMEYRMDYFIRMVSKIVGWSTGFIFIGVLLYKFKTLAGWTTYEVMLLYSFDVLAYSIAATFFMVPCSRLSTYVETGAFDEVLVRPVNTLFYYVCRMVSAGYTSNYAICVFILALSFYKLQITMTPVKIIMFVFMLLGASLIHAAGFLITTIPAFWMIKGKSLHNLFYWNLKSFIQYPISIYQKSIQVLLTVILPYAFINFYPVQYFLDKNDALLFPAFFRYLTPIVGAVLFTLAYLFWEFGINHYKSTGS